MDHPIWQVDVCVVGENVQKGFHKHQPNTSQAGNRRNFLINFEVFFTKLNVVFFFAKEV